MKFRTLATEYDTQRKGPKSAVRFIINDTTEARIRHVIPGNKVAVELEGKNWAAFYDTTSKDIEVMRIWKGSRADLIVRQRVPGLKFELVPTPEFQLKTTLVNNDKVNWAVSPSYDFLNRRGRLIQSLELYNNHKLQLEMDSKLGPIGAVATLSTKPGLRALKSVSLRGGLAVGPFLSLEAEPSKSLALRAVAGLRTRDVVLRAEVKPAKLAGTKLTLEGRCLASSTPKPAFTAGITYDL